ncbi:MAG: enoyl-ACP reductase [Chlorobium sp.]|uniref:Enoyl-[acyl-carrier-protein] reductase [NADH] n=1 Tax=Chlorobium phaeovibrioides TaxID=1094 RepID=A0A432AW45_CHLPH|nr:enoyl-ACP reductase [Chlorobium phaeovibrioides]MDT9546909.1 enoyl-ACP reductase [Chlorobium phaeovibrioides]NQU46792.1 enoyl-ACP reductase [Chlorobium sp.]RTY38456.1 enoyl-ACP reductase [Chlorobium phaeovibrioides]
MSEKAHYGLLKGKKGIVFGPLDESSIGWQIAVHAYREGASIAISNVAAAMRFGNTDELSALCGNAPVIVCDASKNDDVDSCFKELKEKVGKVDFIVHSIGMSQNIRKQLPYEELNYEWFMKTLDVSGLSLHRLVSYALKNDVLNDGASVLALSYIASQRNYWTYSDMGDAKSLLESIVRSYGPRLARRGIRINTISQSPTYTKAGSGIPGFEKMYEYSDLMSPLGNASAVECAEYAMTVLSDLSRKVTMQNLFHDGGYSSMGATIPMIKLAHEVLNDQELATRVGLEDFKPSA